MRKLLPFAVVAVVVLASSPARAQFANRQLGLGVGFTKFSNSGLGGLDFTVPLTLEGGLYVENGFDLYLRIPLMFVRSVSGVINFGLGGQLGARYLFLEETIRPWVGAHLSFTYLFRGDVGNDANAIFGPGINAGCDFFVTDTVSIGPRLFFDLYVALNTPSPLRPAFGGVVAVNTYF